MTGAFVRAGVIGFPVGHSLSPVIHNYWIRQYGLAGAYEALEVPEEMLAQKLEEFVADGYRGLNVTLPHKQAVMALCDDLDPAAREIGAVNTLVFKGGRLSGSNTDAEGFAANIGEQAPDFDFRVGPALVLGAGGAARAVVYALREAGVPEIRIVNRTREKADELAAVFDITSGDWREREMLGRDAALVVNTTALGMRGKPPLEYDVSGLPPETLVCDIVYNPLETNLLRDVVAKGNPVVDGLGMLLHQARPGFRAWFGVLPEITPGLRRALLEKLS